MNIALPRKTGLYISLTAIIIYWAYDLLIKSRDMDPIPASLKEIFITVLTTKIISLIIIFGLLRLEGDTIKDLGFSGEKIFRQLFIGLGFGAASWTVIHLAVNPLLGALNPNPSIAGTDMLVYMKDLTKVLFLIPFVVFSGGIAEEVLRIFVITRFEKWMGVRGLLIATIISSATFGIGHLYQGMNAAIGTGFAGFLYALVYLRKRSAIEAITCHASFNVISIVIGYAINNT